METMLFGLPFPTIAIIIGVPALIMALLIWWGVNYRSSDGEDVQANRRDAQ